MTEGSLNSEPDFSVVIPCFNAESTVNRAFKSVLNQTFLPKEVIFVNDASTDQTQSILNEFSLGTYSFSVRIFKNEINIGPGKSRNLGWNIATSNWIAFLDADDAWNIDKLKIFRDELIRNPEIDLLCSESLLISDELATPKTSNNSVNRDSQKLEARKTLFKNKILTRTVVIRRSVEKRFPTGLAEDFSLWLDCLFSELKVVHINAALSYHYRPEFSPGGISSNLIKHEFYELKVLGKYFKLIPFTTSLALIFSLAKFIRRCLIRVLRRISN
jgi:teichuronic acid biosynthesis glycosyltransferase TuaG